MKRRKTDENEYYEAMNRLREIELELLRIKEAEEKLARQKRDLETEMADCREFLREEYGITAGPIPANKAKSMLRQLDARPKRVSQMIEQTLSASRKGIATLDLVEAINDRWGGVKPIPEATIRVALSRMKAPSKRYPKGRLTFDDGIWRLK